MASKSAAPSSSSSPSRSRSRSPSPSPSPSPSWSALPQDLLIRVASLQTLFLDLFRFRSVCRAWRSAAHAAPPGDLLSRLPFPFLMSTDEADPLIRLFYCVREGKLHRLRFPDDSLGWRCCGSSHGWLAMLSPRAGALLFHPFSGARAELPPLTTLPGVQPRGEGEFLLEVPVGITFHWSMSMTVGAEVLRDVHVEKAVLAMDPRADAVPPLVLLLLHDFAGLVYARLGDEAWTPIPTPGVDSFRDVVYHDGLFYGLSYKDEMVYTIDLFSRDCQTLRTFPPFPDWTFYGSSHLALLPSGVILQVQRHRTHGPDPLKAESFQVLRLNLEEPTKKWVKVTALRGISLFLDGSCSAALYSSRVSGKCRGNCIYFANDERSPGYGRGERVFSGGDFGLFRVKDKAVERGFPPLGVEENMKRPVWVMLSN